MVVALTLKEEYNVLRGILEKVLGWKSGTASHTPFHASRKWDGPPFPMEVNGVTRSDLARLLGVSSAYIAKGLRGNVNFTVDSMVPLVRAAGGEICVQVAPKINTKRSYFHRKQGLKRSA
jgi:DNA-binding transcriptional regulator YdaS (Cro superfamily)